MAEKLTIQDRFEAAVRTVPGLVVLCAITVLCAVAIWYGASALEARAYNNVTGKHVSTWDAMFVELRVQEGAK